MADEGGVRHEELDDEELGPRAQVEEARDAVAVHEHLEGEDDRGEADGALIEVAGILEFFCEEKKSLQLPMIT